ncbi:MAG: deoxyribonuclease IV, partial [Ruminococcus sp.]|nr:deoxyribonuclease IV [Ruminococcus sp.]
QNTILLETMAGKGSEVGGTFEELQAVITQAAQLGGDALAMRLGVCLDTCHVWDGGYDIRHDLDVVLRAFDRVIGLEKLCAVHLNDSKNPCGSHKDRHEKLGQGCIGAEALCAVVRHPLLQDRPFILETPNDDAGYREEIRTVREWMM